jgi:REG-2-like HAD superfamily hydrolase
MNRVTPKKNLLLAFDAFGTLFTPRQPIATQYGDVARRHGLSGFRDDELQASFRRAFKEESTLHPNYGKKVGMKAPEWWSNVISKTFTPFVSSGTQLPDRLVPDLLHRFSSKEGYSLFPDTLPFFQKLRELKISKNRQEWPWQRTVVGVITNSDDRIPGILESFGLKVGSRRFGISHTDPAIDESEDINFVVLSYDVGYEKPDKKIFEAAEKLVGDMIVDSEADLAGFDKVFVGDEPAKDAVGAIAAGWHGIYVNRSEAFWANDALDGGVVQSTDPERSGYEHIRNLGDLTNWRPWIK